MGLSAWFLYFVSGKQAAVTQFIHKYFMQKYHY